MKNIKSIATLLTLVMLGACTTPSSTTSSNTASTVTPTPAQIVAQVCPPLQTALSALNDLVGLPIQAKADLDAVTPIVVGVCAAGATINVASLQTLQQTALPTIINMIKASGMAIEQKNSLILDITAVQLILDAVAQAHTAANK